jgi:deoxyxylulose-5-phosphate synthase
VICGLTTILKEESYTNDFKGQLLNFSLKDKFINDYGSQDSLLKKHGISKEIILKKLMKNVKRSFA